MILLHTPRLLLRTWEDSDIEPFSRMNQDPEVMKYFPSLLTPEESAGRVDWQRRHFKEQGFCCYAVELKSSGEFIGFVGLANPMFEFPFMPAIEIAWRIDKAHWNQGYATEAARYVLNHAFNDLNLTEVVSFTAVQNQASRRVMEKIGLTHDPKDDFDHPRLPEGHPLRRHVLYRISAKTVQAQDSIEIQPYDPHWPLQAQTEIAKIQPLLSNFPGFVDIQHIGSTAIPGLSAKPIIDLAIGVNDLESAKTLIPQLIEQGYVFWDKNPDKSKLFFAKGMPPIGIKRTHHIHVMETTPHDWIVRPLFRDYLIAYPEEREAYQRLKEELAKSFKEDREAYTSAKTAFIQNINQKAVTPYLSFEPLKKNHFPIMLKWFNEPHVQEFYSLRPWTLSEIAEKFQDRVSDAENPSNVHTFIASIRRTPVAYLQCYAVKDHPWEGQNFSPDFIEKAVGLDFFIGEPSFLGKKMASLILESFIPKILKIYPDAKCLIVDPEIQNQRSIRFFEKQGFELHQEISGKDALRNPKKYRLMVKAIL